MPIHTFIINNQENFQKNSSTHNIKRRIKHHLHTANAKLLFFKIKNTFYIGIKIFNSLPGNRTILHNVKAEFKIAGRKYFFVTHLGDPWNARAHMCVCVCVTRTSSCQWKISQTGVTETHPQM